MRYQVEDFKVIAFTHKNLTLELVGKLHLAAEQQSKLLARLKLNFEFEEFLFLSTCNRVELFISSKSEINPVLIK